MKEVRKEFQRYSKRWKEAGFACTREYLEEQLKKHTGDITEKDYVDWLSMAISVSALHDYAVGGYIRVLGLWKSKKKMNKQKLASLSSKHLLRIIDENYDHLQRYLQNMYFLVSFGIPYTLFAEESFKKSIVSAFDFPRIETFHLLTKGQGTWWNANEDNMNWDKTVMTHVLVFEDDDALHYVQFRKWTCFL